MKKDKLFLGCPKCHQIWEYSGYPQDPQLSTIMCLRCNYAAAGAVFPRMNKKGEVKE